MKDKSPAFQFYPKDLLSDGIAMSFSSGLLGAYLMLLCFDWLDDGILDSDSALARLGRLDDPAITEGGKESIRLLRLKFKIHPLKEGFITNCRLAKEREKQTKWREKCSRGGKQSATTRASKGELKYQVNTELKGNTPSSSPSPSIKDIKSSPKFCEFLTAWEAYPLKVGKKEAERHYKKTVTKQPDHAKLMEGLRRYKLFAVQDGRPWLNGATFFNNWQDWVHFEAPDQVRKSESFEDKNRREIYEAQKKDQAQRQAEKSL